MTTKRQKSVGGRNRDQYTATVREEKKAGREADGGREAWKSDTGRKRAKDGHSLTVREGWGEKGMGGWMSGTQMGERKVGNNKSDGWK